jgi:plasmid stabilization system protein ParE
MAKKAIEFKKYCVNMTQNAENDLGEIISFIAHNNPENAMRIMEILLTY